MLVLRFPGFAYWVCTRALLGFGFGAWVVVTIWELLVFWVLVIDVLLKRGRCLIAGALAWLLVVMIVSDVLGFTLFRITVSEDVGFSGCCLSGVLTCNFCYDTSGVGRLLIQV